MDANEAKSLVELLADRSAAWNSLWTVFYTVGAAIVGIVTSGKVLGSNGEVAAALGALGFVVFAVGNYAALAAMRLQREAVVAYVSAQALAKGVPELQALAAASAPPSRARLRAYHWALSGFVVVLLFAMPRLITAASGSPALH